MKNDFDPVKDRRNRSEHGISLGEADNLNWERALKWIDQRRAHGEQRERALGTIAGRLYHVAYVIRGNVRRIISLRKANSRERKRYETDQ